ncbi:MAG TPA: type II toxin-antitoxin system HicB family antitoxin [Tepidisphaeraceae bacterium]|nr:type II toxin-antitoxin system HicB family antitoxin [Tepidisphaeraceae bacterium]
MKIKVVVHEAEEGGFWAEVPSIPGCATQGESFEELLQNLYEAIEGCLSVDRDVEMKNTRRKLAELEALIQKKQSSATRGPAYELSLESMQSMARKLSAEIAEYQRAHQPA